MLKWINKKRNQKGFTLIELVVVIAILGILAAIAVPRLGGFRENANIAADEQLVAVLANATAMHYATNRAVPADSADIATMTGYTDNAAVYAALKSTKYKGTALTSITYAVDATTGQATVTIQGTGGTALVGKK